MLSYKWIAVMAVVSTAAFADDEKDCQNEFRITNARCPEMLNGLSCRETREKVGEVYQKCGEQWEAQKEAKAAREAAEREAARGAASAPPTAAAPAPSPTKSASGHAAPAPSASTERGTTSGNLKAGQGIGRRPCTASSGGVDIDVTSSRTVGVATCRNAIEAEYQKRLCAGKKGQKIVYTWQFADTTGNDDLKCR